MREPWPAGHEDEAGRGPSRKDFGFRVMRLSRFRVQGLGSGGFKAPFVEIRCQDFGFRGSDLLILGCMVVVLTGLGTGLLKRLGSGAIVAR